MEAIRRAGVNRHYYDSNDMDCSNTTTKRLELIREFVALQEELVSEAISKLDPAATEYDCDVTLEPTTTTANGAIWLTNPHGLGVMFVNRETKIIVDAHVGFIDAPNAFDAWRLVQYCESKQRTSEEVRSWQSTLDELVRSGIVEAHSKYEKHYVIA